MFITWAWCCSIVVWKYSALNKTIYFYRAFVVETWLDGFTPKSKEEETSLLSEATPKATQYITEWQQRWENKCAMLEIGWSGRS